MRRALTALAIVTLATPISAQVVQLPSLHTFSVQTSVLVPDSGSAYLGGVGRSSQSRSSRGWSPLAPTSRAGAVVGTGVSVHATIIDHAELDTLVLEEARAIREAKGIKHYGPPTARVALPTSNPPIASVAEIKRALAAEDEAEEAAAATNFQKAADYELQGEYSLARSYYRVAARKSNGPIRERALERLTHLPVVKKTR